jgi:hypothetical protein
LGGEVVLEKLDGILDLLQRGLFRNPPFLETVNETMEDLLDVSEESADTTEDLLEVSKPDREALEEAKRKKEMLRLEKRGGKVQTGDKGWMKGIMGGLMGGAMVLGAIAAAIGALVMMVFDGIHGYFLAEEWGVSKTSAVIGAVIGGTGHGFTGAMWGAAKGGAAGFAIGLGMGGPLGAPHIAPVNPCPVPPITAPITALVLDTPHSSAKKYP